MLSMLMIFVCSVHSVLPCGLLCPPCVRPELCGFSSLTFRSVLFNERLRKRRGQKASLIFQFTILMGIGFTSTEMFVVIHHSAIFLPALC